MIVIKIKRGMVTEVISKTPTEIHNYDIEQLSIEEIKLLPEDENGQLYKLEIHEGNTKRN